MTRTVLQAAAAALGSEPERAFETQLRQAGIWFEREYRFHPERRWRFDFAFPRSTVSVAVEIEGGIWSGGRHTRGSGFVRDAAKYNAASMQGWTVLRVTPEQVESGEALALVERAVGRAR